ncbi:MAG: 16S rRNA (adenine(1518)-N(6)/adenine(1519)-N(6))-dimethyltransferase RsmA [Bacteroidales bacterium]|jgi:16S rRNA (adenine1518-N6/adenine1519-N6)-dimethyltransferase|nr:16S rRNA (adenine(1518)-N(6)/adenine(1519)-N(6))-dimethyltransferase RsmA [Bacteroidales bacterium]
MKPLKPKKRLGQHFLNDASIAEKIVSSLQAENIRQVVEVGPGTGALTPFLLRHRRFETRFIEVDADAVAFLENKYPEIKGKLLHVDFLHYPLDEMYHEPVAVIGNFPYNISTQIFFKILENRNLVREVVGMLQKEVAERIAAQAGSKVYGITSVLLQAFYDIEYLFTVDEHVFTPPPKVKSGVIRLTRNHVDALPCHEPLFVQVVKTAFNQRRKMLRNSLKPLLPGFPSDFHLYGKRPEQLSVQDFIELTNFIEKNLPPDRFKKKT